MEDRSESISLEADLQIGYKRRRTAIACKSCRIKKTRCDGGRPICNHCKEYGFDCSFATPDVGTTQHRGHRTSPQGMPLIPTEAQPQVNTTVDAKQQVISGDIHHDSMQTLLRPSLMAIEERLQRLEECVLLTGTSSQRIHPQSDYSERKRNPNGVSAMGLGHREAAETMFFDTMAPADLATPMLRLVEDDHEGLKMTGTDSSAPKDVTPKPFVQRSLDAKLFQFPERSEAYRLLRVFESETAPLYPLFPGGYLRTAFTLHAGVPAWQLASLPNAVDWCALLMAIFALAYAVDGNKNEALAHGERAHKLLRSHDRQVLRTVMAVQAAVVLCQFLQSTDQHEEAWLTLGWVVRTAFALGLHTNRPCIDDRADTVQEEMACRTYWAIFILDRATTMTLGRPGAIGSYLLGPRLPTLLPGESERSLDFFCRCIRLYEIFGRILESHASSGPIDTNTFTVSLQSWQSDTPLHLSTLFNIPPGPICDISDADISCIVLTFRFFMVRMLVHRPVIGQAMESFRRFSRSASGSTTPVSDTPAFKRNLALCSQDAMRIISLGNSLASAGDWPRGGSSWYRLYYLFSAFTVLAGSLLHTELQTHQDPLMDLPSRTERLQACRDSIGLMSDHLTTCEAAAECAATASRLMNGLQRLEDQSQSVNDSMLDNRTTEEIIAALDAGVPDIEDFLNSDWLNSHSYLEGSGMSDAFWGLSAGNELNYLLTQANV